MGRMISGRLEKTRTAAWLDSSDLFSRTTLDKMSWRFASLPDETSRSTNKNWLGLSSGNEKELKWSQKGLAICCCLLALLVCTGVSIIIRMVAIATSELLEWPAGAEKDDPHENYPVIWIWRLGLGHLAQFKSKKVYMSFSMIFATIRKGSVTSTKIQSNWTKKWKGSSSQTFQFSFKQQQQQSITS